MAAMDRIDPSSHSAATIADKLLSAPGWARVGLTAPTEHLREAAAIELAHAVLEGSEGRQSVPSDQLTLGFNSELPDG
jgi:hypothetical protein